MKNGHFAWILLGDNLSQLKPLTDIQQNLSLFEIDVSMRAIGIFKRSNLKRIDDLVNMTEAQFRRLPGCGYKTLHEVKDCLNKNGLSFASKPVKQIKICKRVAIKNIINGLQNN